MKGSLFLVFLVVHVSVGFGCQEDTQRDNGGHMFLVKYKVQEQVMPHYMLANPRPYMQDVPAYKCFSSVETAVCWITSENKSESDIYGVYELKPIQLERVQTGTQRVTRNVPTEVEEPVFEWKMIDQKE
jgi:hypothetical protein